ncbi:hypothetical protein FMEAI12_2620006 [Parafrankia sp. Ea1.12]|nr:hypothetical protein FMEAI12_2620006 [Parafrankia sp. Ea1.12]
MGGRRRPARQGQGAPGRGRGPGGRAGPGLRSQGAAAPAVARAGPGAAVALRPLPGVVPRLPHAGSRTLVPARSEAAVARRARASRRGYDTFQPD